MYGDNVLAGLSAGDTIVTANNRLARNIKLAYNRGQRALRLSAWRTPHAIPWRVWIGELWSSAFARGGEAGRHTLLGEAQSRALWRDVVIEAGVAPLPGTAAAIAQLAGRAWHLTQDWMLTPADLAAMADSDDSRTFAALAAAFQRRCEARSWADSGTVLPQLAADARSGKLGPPDKIRLSGFDDLAPAQRELLRVLAGAGWTLTEEAAPEASTANVRQIRCDDSANELELAARWARAKMERAPGAVIGIVIPDLGARVAETRRRILDVFAPDWRLAPAVELPVNFSCGEPLPEIGLVHVALLVLRALTGRLDYRDAGQLLRTPYMRGSGAESAVRADLDLSLRERIGTTLTVAELALRARDKSPQLAAQLVALSHVASSLPRRQSASAWMRTFSDALLAGGWPGDRPLGSDEYQAVAAWQELLGELRSCDPISGTLSLAGALDLLNGLARDHVFQPAGHPDAVQVLGLLEAVGQRFDGLWISGLTSAAWPPAPRPDPLIPLVLQRERRMPDSTPPMAREQAERLLRWLQASAPEVVVSWPGYAGDEPLSPSPLIAHLPAGSPAGLSLWAGRDRRAAIVASRGTEVLAADPAPPVDPCCPPRGGGAALLERQSRCPARAFVEFRLGAREMCTPAIGIDAATRGAVTHGVLQDFFARIPTQAQLLELAESAQGVLLDSLIRRRLDQELPMADPLVRRIAEHERERLRLVLHDFLKLERERQPFQVLATEADLASPASLPGISRLQITMRADRIDLLAGGERLIIDYKTGAFLPSLAEWCGPRPRSPQLPLYATITDAHGIAFVHLTAAGTAWRALGTDSLALAGRTTVAELPSKGANWEELRAGWRSSLERLAAEIIAGDFRIDRRHRQEAEGQWAMATRVHELPDAEEAES